MRKTKDGPILSSLTYKSTNQRQRLHALTIRSVHNWSRFNGGRRRLVGVGCWTANEVGYSNIQAPGYYIILAGTLDGAKGVEQDLDSGI
jgi:hypothetical protein